MKVATITAVAAAVFASGTSAYICTNFTVPITISARNGVFNLAVPQTSLQVPDLVLNITQQGRNFTDTVLTGYATVGGTYNISAKYCRPSSSNSTSNSTSNTLQILTHGIGFDKTYWDLPYANYNNSYIKVATDTYGYSTFSYDRLGIGNSSHGEPLNEIQSFLEIAALAKLTASLRNGNLSYVNQTFSKYVHVGHSFGSAQTYAFANLYPNMTNGIVLTGFSMNSSFVPFFAAGANFVQANENQPLRFGSVNGTVVQNYLATYAGPLFDYLAPVDLTTLAAPQNLSNGYLVSSDAEANKYLFLKPHYFSPGILTLAEKTKQPVTPGELLTLGSLTMANNFAGPVLVITGSNDLPYCGGDCLATGNSSLASIPAKVASNFPYVASSNFTAYIQPNSGHGINLHYNATGAYNVINTFLKGKGL